MKKILISLLFVLVSAVSANAQLLYRVSGADLKKPSYVFGTFHLANSPLSTRLPVCARRSTLQTRFMAN